MKMIFTCCLGAASLYLLSRRTGRNVEMLKSATRVHNLKDLADLLEAEKSKVFPVIMAVSGSVGSETPIKCELSDILAVIVEETVEQHFLKQTWKFSWVQSSALMQPITKEVPWHLDDGTGRVNVVGAQSAIGFALKVGNEVFEKSGPSSFLKATLDYIRGLKMLGVRRSECVLPIGTRLTVVGEAIKDGNGDVRIQKPDSGPFYISSMPLDQLIFKLGKWSRRFKYASIGLAVLGVAMISKPVIEYILEGIDCILKERRRRQLLLERARDEAARRIEPVSRGSNHLSFTVTVPPRLERQHARLERQYENRSDGRSSDGEASELCVICLQQKRNTAFVVCGHVCCCNSCYSRLPDKRCPICRRPINQALKIYYP